MRLTRARLGADAEVSEAHDALEEARAAGGSDRLLLETARLLGE